MVRLIGRRNGPVEKFMGSLEARQAVTAADVEDNENKIKTVEESESEVTPARSKDPDKQEDTGADAVSKSDATWTETDKNASTMTSFMAGLGAGAAGPGTAANTFFGSVNSQTGKDWGVNPVSMDDIMNNPSLFLELFDQNVGASGHMDESDFQMFGNQSLLETIADPTLGASSFDRTAARAENAQTPGGNFVTMGDVMTWVETDGAGSEAINQYDPTDLNNLMLGSVQGNYPGMILSATKSMLDDAAVRYEAAVATGYQGTYLDFLNEDGLAEHLRRM